MKKFFWFLGFIALVLATLWIAIHLGFEPTLDQTNAAVAYIAFVGFVWYNWGSKGAAAVLLITVGLAIFGVVTIPTAATATLGVYGGAFLLPSIPRKKTA